MFPFYHESIPAASGIYKITCVPTGKFYIGSAVNLQRRRKGHFGTLQRNEHDNPKLQHAFNKYGPETFTFEILELVLPMSLTAREQWWFNKLQPFGHRGFNIDRVAGSRYGSVMPPHVKEMLIAIRRSQPSPNRGKKASDATRERLRVSHLGKKQSEETIRKRSATVTGRKRNPEAIEKTRLKNLGKKRSAEVCAKNRAGHIGIKSDPNCHASQMKTLIVTSPDGIEYHVFGVKRFCREHHLTISSLMGVAKGKYKQYKGWKARYPETDVS